MRLEVLMMPILISLATCLLCDRGRDLGPPWLLFASESGRGKRVPLSAFRLSMFNRMGLRGYKVQFVFFHFIEESICFSIKSPISYINLLALNLGF